MTFRITMAALALAGTLTGAGIAEAQQTIRVGVIQPLSGPLAPYANETQLVIEYMTKKINADGGIKSLGGAKLELVVADSASKSTQSAVEVRRLITQEKVDVVIGSLLTSEMLAVSSVVDEYKVPTISLLAGASRSEYLYSIGLPYDSGYARGMVDFVAYLMTQPGFNIKRAATAYTNYEAGQQINKYITERLKALGIEIVGDFALDSKAADLLPVMLKIRAAKPDIVIGLQLHGEIMKMQQARFQLKYYDSLFIGNTGFADPTVKKDLGDIAREVLPKGVFGLALYSPTAKIPAARAIADEVSANVKMPKGFGQYAIAAAQGIRVLQAALEAAGSKDPAKLRAAIAAVEIKPGDPHLYMPLSKGLAFNQERVIRDMETMLAEWGEADDPIVVYPERFSARKPWPPR